MTSYAKMDHARWVQAAIDAMRSRKPTAAERRNAAARKGAFAAPQFLTPFQAKAFNILGIVGGGISNCPISWETVYWQPHCISVQWRRPMSTWDFGELTLLVFLSHAARIRSNITPHGPGAFLITMSGLMDDHPDLDTAVATFKGWLPPEHMIWHREPEAAA